jgi:hypothetical protein
MVDTMSNQGARQTTAHFLYEELGRYWGLYRKSAVVGRVRRGALVSGTLPPLVAFSGVRLVASWVWRSARGVIG